jgi:hypothetical protein
MSVSSTKINPLPNTFGSGTLATAAAPHIMKPGPYVH